MKVRSLIFWLAKIVAALIMLQTLYFKFTASKESVYIFTKVGIEPFGRIGIGALELVASILILIPATAYLGAGLALGLMVGALGLHLTLLGIQVMNDGGQLFIYALVVAICSAYILWVEKEKIFRLLHQLFPKKS